MERQTFQFDRLLQHAVELDVLGHIKPSNNKSNAIRWSRSVTHGLTGVNSGNNKSTEIIGLSVRFPAIENP